jgi:hypothetical protein
MDQRHDLWLWPPLPRAAWADTYATLHMWTQVIGKVRLALAPPSNHWWHVTLKPTPCGLTTGPMPLNAGRSFEMSFDFVKHVLAVGTSDGAGAALPLSPRSVAEFYADVMARLGELGIRVRIWPMPVEVPSPIRFDQDGEHRSYDRVWVERWWRIVSQSAAVLEEFRGRFIGKSSPVHFFWGSFDLAVTRFSGRRAPDRPGADSMTREAYSHEVISAGFWPGGGPVAEAAFYAYAAPEPAGFKMARVQPREALYSADLNEFILMYEDVRTAEAPHAKLLEFLESTYEAGASLGQWPRRELEREGSPA